MRLDDHPYLGCNDDAIRRKTFVRVSVHCLLAFFLSFFRFFSFLMSVFVALQESSRVCVCVCVPVYALDGAHRLTLCYV
jgi:hypothetical protein